MTHQKILEAYMAAWCHQDGKELDQYFTEDVYDSECYGPVYQGLEQMICWFDNWNQKGRVLEWNIQRVIDCGDTLVAQWHFSCLYNG